MEEEEATEPSSLPIPAPKIVEEDVHLTDLIPSSRLLIGCCRTVLWGIVETCVRQEALSEAGLTDCLNHHNHETRTVEEVNDEMPFLDAQKQLLSDMVDLLGIPTDGNDENLSLPLQFGAKVQRSKGTKKALRDGNQPQPQQKKTRLGVDTENNDATASEVVVECLSLPVPHDEATMVEENVYLARYSNTTATSTATTTAAMATMAAVTKSTTTTAATIDYKESSSSSSSSSSNQTVENVTDDDALYPIRILGNGPNTDR